MCQYEVADDGLRASSKRHGVAVQLRSVNESGEQPSLKGKGLTCPLGVEVSRTGHPLDAVQLPLAMMEGPSLIR